MRMLINGPGCFYFVTLRLDIQYEGIQLES